MELELVIAVADVVRRDGVLFTAAALMPLHDGRRLFWDETQQNLIYKGPVSELIDSLLGKNKPQGALH